MIILSQRSRNTNPTLNINRDSVATYWDAQGILRTAPPHQLRPNFDPATGLFLGWLIQKQWTNSLKDPRDLSTAEWSETNSVSIAQDRTGLDGVSNAAWTATDSGSGISFISQSRPISNDGATHSFVFYIDKNSGDESNGFPAVQAVYTGGTLVFHDVTIDTRDGSNAAPSGRADGSHTVTDAGDYWRIEINMANNSSGNTSVRYGVYPAYASTLGGDTDSSATGTVGYDFGGIFLNSDFAPSTPIHDPSVSGAAVTQSADDITSTIGSDFNTSEFAYVIEAIMPPVNPGDVNTLYSIDSTNTGIFAIQLEGSAGSNTIQQRVPGTSRVDVGTVPFGSKFRYAVTYTGTDYRVSLNGGPVIALAESAETDGPTGFIGNRLGATDTEYNSTINLIRQVPRALSDAELQKASRL